MPYVLTATVAPGVEGMFVPTGAGDRWIYDIEWHPEAGETLADWPVERLAGADPSRGRPARPAAGDHRACSPGTSARRSLSGSGPAGPSWSVTRPTGRRRAGATGMNTGIADGHNLGWKLAWVVRGWADESLLDTLRDRAAPVGPGQREASLETASGSDVEHALAQDFGVRYASGAALGGHVLAGRRAPHAWVSVDGRRVSTLDLFGDRLTVLTGPAVEPGVSAAARRRCSRWAGTSLDPDGGVRRGVRAGGGGRVLVRPDGYVAWAGPAAKLDDAVAAVTGRGRPLVAVRGLEG